MPCIIQYYNDSEGKLQTRKINYDAENPEDYSRAKEEYFELLKKTNPAQFGVMEDSFGKDFHKSENNKTGNFIPDDIFKNEASYVQSYTTDDGDISTDSYHLKNTVIDYSDLTGKIKGNTIDGLSDYVRIDMNNPELADEITRKLFEQYNFFKAEFGADDSVIQKRIKDSIEKINDNFTRLLQIAKNNKDQKAIVEISNILNNIKKQPESIGTLVNYVQKSIFDSFDIARRQVTINSMFKNLAPNTDMSEKSFRTLTENLLFSKSLLETNYPLNDIYNAIHLLDSLDNLNLDKYSESEIKFLKENVAPVLREILSNRNTQIELYKSQLSEYMIRLVEPVITRFNDKIQSEGGKDKFIITKDKLAQDLKEISNDLNIFERYLSSGANSKDEILGAVITNLMHRINESKIEYLKFYEDFIKPIKENKINNLDDIHKSFIRDITITIPEYDETGNKIGEKTITKKAYHTEYDTFKYEEDLKNLYEELGTYEEASATGTIKKYFDKLNKFKKENQLVTNGWQEEIAKKIENKTEAEIKFILNTDTVAIREENLKYVDDNRILRIKNKNGVLEKVFFYTSDGRKMVRILKDDSKYIKPSEKYKNAAYEELMKNPYFVKTIETYNKANELLGNPLLHGIMFQVEKTLLEKLRGVDLEKAGKIVKEFFNFSAKDNKKNIKYDLDGRELKQVPKRFINWKSSDESDITDDSFKSLNLAMYYALKYKYLSEADFNLKLINDAFIGNTSLGLNTREAVKKGAKVSGESNATKLYKDFIENVFYDDSDLALIIGNLDVSKVLGKFNSFTALSSLGLNLIGSINHAAVTMSQILIEAAGRRHFTLEDWNKGTYTLARFSSLINAYKLPEKQNGNILSFLVEYFDAVQGEFTNQLGNKVESKAMNKIFAENPLFVLYTQGFYAVQTTAMLSHFEAIKHIDGKFISRDDYNTFIINEELKKIAKASPEIKKNVVKKLWEKYDKAKSIGSMITHMMVNKKMPELDEFNNMKLFDEDGEYIWDRSHQIHTKDVMSALSKYMLGNYSKEDKAPLSRLWWGKMMIMFHRQIYGNVINRWSVEKGDMQLGNTRKGYYLDSMNIMWGYTKDIFNMLIGNIKNNKGTQKYGYLGKDLTFQEKENLRKSFFEVGTQLASAALFALLLGTEKDEQKKRKNDIITGNLLLLLKRYEMNIATYQPQGIIPEGLKTLNQPFVTESTLKKTYRILYDLMTAVPDLLENGEITKNVYSKDYRSHKKGDWKGSGHIIDILPGARQWFSTQSPETNLNFYEASFTQMFN